MRSTSRHSQRLREEHDVRLVVPLNDLDFPVLARERDRLSPALVLLPDPEATARMSDKLEAHRFFVANGIPSPRSWAPEDVPDDVRYPVLVKAREGFGSRNIHRATNADELAFFLGYSDVPSFVQEACLGEEFSIDVFCDMEARCLNAIPRTMLLSKGGESIKGASIQDRELIEHGARVAEVGRDQRARRTCSASVSRTARFRSRTSTRASAAGSRFRSPRAAAIRSSRSRSRAASRPEPRLGDFQDGVVMTRYFSEVCLAPGDDGALTVVHRP